MMFHSDCVGRRQVLDIALRERERERERDTRNRGRVNNGESNSYVFEGIKWIEKV